MAAWVRIPPVSRKGTGRRGCYRHGSPSHTSYAPSQPCTRRDSNRIRRRSRRAAADHLSDLLHPCASLQTLRYRMEACPCSSTLAGRGCCRRYSSHPGGLSRDYSLQPARGSQYYRPHLSLNSHRVREPASTHLGRALPSGSGNRAVGAASMRTGSRPGIQSKVARSFVPCPRAVNVVLSTSDADASLANIAFGLHAIAILIGGALVCACGDWHAVAHRTAWYRRHLACVGPVLATVEFGTQRLKSCRWNHPPAALYPNLSHPIPSHPIPSHPIPAHPIPSYPILSQRIPCHHGDMANW